MPDPDGKTTILFRGAPKGLDRKALRRFAERLSAEVAGGRPFSCLISGDRELLRLNREFLGRDYPADVLSFPAPGGAPVVPSRHRRERSIPPTAAPSSTAAQLGEIAISGARAREQAAALGHGVEDEISILMLHGVLHLLGMDHETDRGGMRRLERRWREKLGLPAGLIERSGA